MAEFENPFADPEAQNLFHVSSYFVSSGMLANYMTESCQIICSFNEAIVLCPTDVSDVS